MASDPPDRATISFPDDSEVSLDDVDDLVDAGEYESRSEAVREALKTEIEPETPE